MKKENQDVRSMHPAEQIAFVMTRIYERGMTTLSGGNISVMDDSGDLWISPSGVDKGSLTAADIMCVRADGTIVGPHRPSSEYPFHKALLATRRGMRAVVHAHPPALVAFSIVHEIPDTRISADIYDICGEVGFAAYDLPGSDILGERIADEFRRKPHINAVVMENHGTVLCGVDLMEAYDRFETLEYCCRMLLGARPLGGHRSLSDGEMEAYRRAAKASRLPGHPADKTVPPAEQKLRKEICAVAARSCRQELMSGAMGVISARLSETEFLITPQNAVRWALTPEDIIKVSVANPDPERFCRHDFRPLSGLSGHPADKTAPAIPAVPIAQSPVAVQPAGSAPQTPPQASLHGEIYRNYPEIQVVMNASPVNIMSYAVASRTFDVRTIPESWILLKDVPLLSMGTGYTSPSTIIDLLQTTPCMLSAGEGILVTGTSLLNAFDRLEVAELSTKSLIMAAPIGQLHPIDDREVEELRIAFKVK